MCYIGADAPLTWIPANLVIIGWAGMTKGLCSMPKIIFSRPKLRIAEFDAQEVEFERQEGGLLLTASGTMIAQDTNAVEALMQGDASCHVEIIKEGASVINQTFQLTVFAFEAEQIAVLLR